MTPPVLVYATVLYWQQRELPHLQRAVESLVGQHLGDGIQLRVIVVDNGCGATPSLPPNATIELMRLRGNRGFAGGHNEAVRVALERGADYVFLFNSDACAEAGALRELVEVAQAHPRAAFIGPVILRADAPEVIASAGQSFSRRTARHRELRRGRHISAMPAFSTRVDAVSGCALLAKCTSLQEIGLLDETLFCYFEDMDWCLRAWQAGYEVIVAPRSRVTHVGQASTAHAPSLSTHYSVRNHMLVAARYCTGTPAALLMPMVIAFHLLFIMRLDKRRAHRHLAALLSGAFAACSRQSGAWHPPAAAFRPHSKPSVR